MSGLEEQVNATDGTPTDILTRALQRCEEEKWPFVIVIGEAGDDGALRLLSSQATTGVLIGSLELARRMYLKDFDAGPSIEMGDLEA